MAVGLDGCGEGGVLVGAADELFGMVVDVVGRALVVFGLAGAEVDVGRGLVVADRVADEVVGSADGAIGAGPDDVAAPLPVAVPGDCLPALPGVAYTRVLRRAVVVVALRCSAARAASRAASTCWVSCAAAATAAPVAATADTVTSPVATPSRRTARSRDWGVHLPLAERITPESWPPTR